MPASRLSEGQRAEMVEKLRQGVATVVLANTYDCSPNTVSRLVKAAMDGEEYERLKRQRQRRADVMDEPASELDAPLDLAADLQAAGSQLPLDPSPGAAVQQPEPSPESSRQPELPGLLEISSAEPAPPPPRPEVLSPQSSSSAPSPTLAEAPALAVAPEVPSPLELEPPQEAEPSVLAIEDADDFGDDEDDDDLSGDDDLNEDDPFGDGSQPLNEVFLPVPLLQIGIEATATGPLAWGSAALPSSAYMLVEKTVELQPQVLRELPELGQLPEDEQERQALVLFVNPRQAKRQCGRNQRVIRIPDIQVFELTAPKLVAQGITRVVVEGSLFALPGC